MHGSADGSADTLLAAAGRLRRLVPVPRRNVMSDVVGVFLVFDVLLVYSQSFSGEIALGAVRLVWFDAVVS